MPTNPELIKLCQLWDKLTEELNKMGLFDKEDYEVLRCKAEGNEAEVTVGVEDSGSPLIADIYYDKRKLEYYDEYEDVDRIVKKLMEQRAGARCDFMREDEDIVGVSCEDIRNFEEAFKVLGSITSSAYRMYEPTKWYGPNFEKLDGECRIEDDIEREICAINKLLEKLEARLKRI